MKEAIMFRTVLMYDVNFYTFFGQPKRNRSGIMDRLMDDLGS